MAIAEDIRALAERTNRDLDAVHDFFEHSKVVWRFLRDLVDAGRKTAIQNEATGNTADQDELLRLAPRYASEYLDTSHLESWRLIKKVVEEVAGAAATRLA